MPHNPRPWAKTVLLALAAAFTLSASAQNPPETPGPPSGPPSGQVLSSAPTTATLPPDTLPTPRITDAERASILITALSLDLHLIPADLREETRTTITLRNASSTPVARIPLQISSTLHWQSVAVATSSGLQPIPFTQSPIGTDADHTGYAQEAVITPTQPLAPGATLTLSAFYSGEIRQSGAGIESLGASHEKALQSEWDQIAPTTDQSATALRGFGHVLWYPVAAPVAILGDGNKLFETIEHQRILNLTSTIRLRLTVDYIGDPPVSVLFNGQLRPLAYTPDTDNQPIENSHGLATAEFPPDPIGFRIPSLFLTAQQPVTTPDELLTVITPHSEAIQTYASAAAEVHKLFTPWLGETPLQPLILLDHPGDPYQDEAFIAGELDAAASNQQIAPALVSGLTHAWITKPAKPAKPSESTPQATLWLDQGLPEFFSLLWTERIHGREAALAELQQTSSLLALSEPDLSATPTPPGQPLLVATSQVYLRLKSAAVLWQLREILTESIFRDSLKAWRNSTALNPSLERDPHAFQTSIERTSKQDLTWFFEDWVNRDRGLPDLTLVNATPRPLPARPGKNGGYLVAVEVRNDGDAVADVPVTVRAVTTSATQRLRIQPHTTNSIRIVFEDTPISVQVNDGSTPELRSSTHTLNLTPPTTP